MTSHTRIWSSPNLPTLPAVAFRLLELSRSTDTEIRDIVGLIKTDPALVAKILKSANSSYFGFSSRIHSIERAVPLLGTTVVTSLALSFSLAESATVSGPMYKHFRDYWLQSIVQAAAAELVKQHAEPGLEFEFFLTGLLLDVGRLAMLKTIPQQYEPVLVAAETQQRELHDVESELLGINHVSAGVKLMDNWRLPSALIESTRFHHAPLEELREFTSLPCYGLIKVCAVSGAVGDYFCGADKASAFERLTKLTREFYGFSTADLDGFLNSAKSRIDEAGELLSADTGNLLEPSELMALANEQLAQMAIREHAASARAVARQQAAEREKQELESKNRDLEQRVLYDPLTQTYNRLFFDEALQREIDRCSRIAAPLGVIFLDVDNFKAINDAYGHQFGDKVLLDVAQTCETVVRKADTLARYGGEEFVVLVSEPTEAGIKRVAERIRSAVEGREIRFGNERVPVTVSAGAALVIPERHATGIDDRLVRAADDAMYESKRNGRNRVHFQTLLDANEQALLELVNARRFSRWLVRHEVFNIPTLSKVLVNCQPQRERIGFLAQQENFLNLKQVDQIMVEQERTGRRFGAVAVELGLLTDEQLAHLLALQREDPQMLARRLVADRLLDSQRANTLLEQFQAEIGTADGEAPRERREVAAS